MAYKDIVLFILCLLASMPLLANNNDGQDFQESATPVGQSPSATESQQQGNVQFPQGPQLPASEGGGPLFPDIDVDGNNKRLDVIEQWQAQSQLTIKEQQEISKLSKFFRRLNVILNQNKAFIEDFYTDKGYECIVGQQVASQLAQDLVELKQHQAFIQQRCQDPMGPKAREYCQKELTNTQHKISYFEQFQVDFENNCK